MSFFKNTVISIKAASQKKGTAWPLIHATTSSAQSECLGPGKEHESTSVKGTGRIPFREARVDRVPVTGNFAYNSLLFQRLFLLAASLFSSCRLQFTTNGHWTFNRWQVLVLSINDNRVLFFNLQLQYRDIIDILINIINLFVDLFIYNACSEGAAETRDFWCPSDFQMKYNREI